MMGRIYTQTRVSTISNDGSIPETLFTFSPAIEAAGTILYFDASTAGPTDVDTVWSGDASAFDGNFTTNASCGTDDGILKGTGLSGTIPASTKAIYWRFTTWASI